MLYQAKQANVLASSELLYDPNSSKLDPLTPEDDPSNATTVYKRIKSTILGSYSGMVIYTAFIGALALKLLFGGMAVRPAEANDKDPNDLGVKTNKLFMDTNSSQAYWGFAAKKTFELGTKYNNLEQYVHALEEKAEEQRDQLPSGYHTTMANVIELIDLLYVHRNLLAEYIGTEVDALKEQTNTLINQVSSLEARLKDMQSISYGTNTPTYETGGIPGATVIRRKNGEYAITSDKDEKEKKGGKAGWIIGGLLLLGGIIAAAASRGGGGGNGGGDHTGDGGTGGPTGQE